MVSGADIATLCRGSEDWKLKITSVGPAPSVDLSPQHGNSSLQLGSSCSSVARFSRSRCHVDIIHVKLAQRICAASLEKMCNKSERYKRPTMGNKTDLLLIWKCLWISSEASDIQTVLTLDSDDCPQLLLEFWGSRKLKSDIRSTAFVELNQHFAFCRSWRETSCKWTMWSILNQHSNATFESLMGCCVLLLLTTSFPSFLSSIFLFAAVFF